MHTYSHWISYHHKIYSVTGNICRKYGKGGIWGALRMWTPDMSWALHGRRCGLSGSQWSCYLGIACAWKIFTFLYKCWVLWHGQVIFLAFYAWKYLTLSLTYSAHQPLTLPNLCFQQGLDQLTSKFGTLDHIGVAFVKDLRFSPFFFAQRFCSCLENQRDEQRKPLLF